MVPQALWIKFFFFLLVQIKWLPKTLVKPRFDEAPSRKLPFLITPCIYLHSHSSQHSEEPSFKGRGLLFCRKWWEHCHSEVSGLPWVYVCLDWLQVWKGKWKSFFFFHSQLFLFSSIFFSSHAEWVLSNDLSLSLSFSNPRCFLLQLYRVPVSWLLLFTWVSASPHGSHEPCFIHSGVAGKSWCFSKIDKYCCMNEMFIEIFN